MSQLDWMTVFIFIVLTSISVGIIIEANSQQRELNRWLKNQREKEERDFKLLNRKDIPHE